MSADTNKELTEREIKMSTFLDDEESPESFVNQLEMVKWETEPQAKQTYDDINKDSVHGNLTEIELNVLLFGEDFISGIASLKSLINDPVIGNYFLPDNITQGILRTKGSLLALSNSREGFFRKLKASRILKKELSYDDGLFPREKSQSEKGGMFQFFNRNKK